MYTVMYKFNRLLFGIKVAPDIFQQIMDTMLSGFDFAVAYLDILLKSENPEHKCFWRFQKNSGLWIQAERRSEFFMGKIKYLCQIIDKGRRPDPTRASAIRDMTASENVTSPVSWG